MPEPRRSRQELVRGYKSVLRECIDQRPSGMRRKIAEVLGTHKSFISQITNPADPTPIPSRHLEAIIDVCHLSPAEQDRFLAAYGEAHPEQREPDRSVAPLHYRSLHLQIPVLSDPDRQEALEAVIRDTVRRICAIIEKR